MICKCKRQEEYWNSFGSSRVGLFTRKKLMLYFFIFSLPGIGFILFLYNLIGSLITAGDKNRVPKMYRFSEFTIKQDQEQEKSE